MLLSEAFERYRLDRIVFGNQSPKTEETHNCTLKRLIECHGDIDVRSLTFDKIRDWKLWLDKGRSPSTVREYVIRLRVVLRHLQLLREECVDYSLIPIPKRPEKIPEFITKEQVSEVISEALKPRRGYPERNRLRNAAIISLLYASGIRASELLSLDRANIRDDGTFTVIGKGNKSRLCFTDGRTQELLHKYMSLRSDTSSALFISEQGTVRRMSKSNLQRVFDNLRTKVELPVLLHPHTLRHSFAYNLLRNNCNHRYAQKFMGHANLSTLQIYQAVVDEDLKEVYLEKHTT